MSGLDTSQEITDQASLNAEKFHVHSHPEKKDDKRPASADPQPDDSATSEDVR